MSEPPSEGPEPPKFRPAGEEVSLDAIGVFEISRQLTYLLGLGVGSQVVYEDGAVEQGNSGYALWALKVLRGHLTKHDLCAVHHENLADIERDFETTYVSGTARRLTATDFERLKRLSDDLSFTLVRELAKRDFAETRPPKGILDYERLRSEGVSALIRDKDIANRLPTVVAADLADAINCVATGIATPGVMVALRATEGMLRFAYEKIVGPLKGSLNWHEVSQGLFEKLESSGLKSAQLEGYVEYFRDMRNKAEHPERRFNFIEGEDFLMHVQYLIKELFRLIDKAEQGEASKPV